VNPLGQLFIGAHVGVYRLTGGRIGAKVRGLHLVLLTTTGRKTGKQRRKCVRAIRRGNSVYIVSIGGPEMAWLKNIQANPDISLRIAGGTFAGRARELSDPLEIEQAREAYCEPVHVVDYMACMNWRKGRPTHSRIRDLTRGWFEEGVPLVVELAAGARRGVDA
jgi:deazaflavin-dependent oxidoreductase (nitroreductase family)